MLVVLIVQEQNFGSFDELMVRFNEKKFGSLVVEWFKTTTQKSITMNHKHGSVSWLIFIISASKFCRSSNKLHILIMKIHKIIFVVSSVKKCLGNILSKKKIQWKLLNLISYMQHDLKEKYMFESNFSVFRFYA